MLAACSDAPQVLITLQPPPSPTPVEKASIVAQPAAVVGAALFSENCVACHGENGEGDGPLVLNQQVPTIGNFRLGEHLERSPQDWFETITYGKLERLMPPWSSLGASDRWELAWYSYTLAYSDEELEHGAALWESHCASCHGDPTGGKAPSNVALERANLRLRDLDYLSQLGDEQITASIRSIHPELILLTSLDDHDLQNLTRFVRSLSLGGFGYWADVETLPPLDLPKVNLVINLPADWSGADSEVWLSASVAGEVRERWSAATIEGTRAQFYDIPLIESWHYQAHASSSSDVFRSLFYPADQLTGIRSITLYEHTTGADVLKQDSLALQFLPVDTPNAGEFFRVTQALRLTNTATRLYAESEARAWQLPLPVGANLIEIGATRRHDFDQEENNVFGWQPILPGAGELVGLQYLLPKSILAVYEYHLPYGLNGALRILLPGGDWVLLGADLPLLGEEVINGRLYQSYGADASLPPGSVLRFGIGMDDSAANYNALEIGAVLLILALVFLSSMGMIGWLRRRW